MRGLDRLEMGNGLVRASLVNYGHLAMEPDA
jgi:hypothetical protein